MVTRLQGGYKDGLQPETLADLIYLVRYEFGLRAYVKFQPVGWPG